jgi:hypothetical protein
MTDYLKGDAAVTELTSLLQDGFQPKKLDELYDMMKLLGVVLGYQALLEAATSGTEKERVPAARALINLKEDPEAIAERLRRSPFADLTVVQLSAIVEKMKSGETDIQKLVEEVKHAT